MSQAPPQDVSVPEGLPQRQPGVPQLRFHVSASVAKATGSIADYIRTHAPDDELYAKLIADYCSSLDKPAVRTLIID